MSDASLYEALREIFRSVFERDDLDLTPALSSRDVPGWDSLRHIEILVSVEERFDTVLDSEDIDGLQNVGDLVRVIERKIAEKKGTA